MSRQQTHTPHLQAIYRYPVKGLSPERLSRASLTLGDVISGDRIYALENGSADFDAATPRYFPKTKFLMLMKHERLAQLRTRFDLATHMLTVSAPERQDMEVDLSTATGRRTLESFIRAFMPLDVRGVPRVVFGEGHSFSDVAMKCVSIINLASLRDLEIKAQQTLNPLRFRANLYLEGLEPWVEMHWLDKTLHIGEADMIVAKTTLRCAATQVNPETARRDIDVPRLLRQHFGHQILGVYARITTAGRISQGDAVTGPC